MRRHGHESFAAGPADRRGIRSCLGAEAIERRGRSHRHDARAVAGHLAGEQFKQLHNLDIAHVHYRGAAPALNDLLGGHIDAMFDAMPVMAVQAKEGKVTPLAVTGSKRSFALPEVPTIQESGLDYLINGWYGILAPPETPAPIVQRLRDEAAKAVAQQDAVATLASQGMEPRGTQPGDWGQYMKSEMAFYSKIIKDADIKP